jgi:hypothetical protein
MVTFPSSHPGIFRFNPQSNPENHCKIKKTARDPQRSTILPPEQEQIQSALIHNE